MLIVASGVSRAQSTGIEFKNLSLGYSFNPANGEISELVGLKDAATAITRQRESYSEVTISPSNDVIFARHEGSAVRQALGVRGGRALSGSSARSLTKAERIAFSPKGRSALAVRGGASAVASIINLESPGEKEVVLASLLADIAVGAESLSVRDDGQGILAVNLTGLYFLDTKRGETSLLASRCEGMKVQYVQDSPDAFVACSDRVQKIEDAGGRNSVVNLSLGNITLTEITDLRASDGGTYAIIVDGKASRVIAAKEFGEPLVEGLDFAPTGMHHLNSSNLFLIQGRSSDELVAVELLDHTFRLIRYKAGDTFVAPRAQD